MAQKDKKKSTIRQREQSSISSMTRSSSSSSRNVKRQEPRKSGEAKTVYIDSEVLKDRSARYYRRSRSQSMVKGYRSPTVRLSSSRHYREPVIVKVPTGANRYRESSTDSSTTSGFNSSSSSSISSSGSSDTFAGDVSRVKIIKVNQNNDRVCVDDGQMFVFDSRKYRIEELPSRQRRQYHHHTRHSRNRQNRNMGWTVDGESFVAYQGSDSKMLYWLQ